MGISIGELHFVKVYKLTQTHMCWDLFQGFQILPKQRHTTRTQTLWQTNPFPHHQSLALLNTEKWQWGSRMKCVSCSLFQNTIKVNKGWQKHLSGIALVFLSQCHCHQPALHSHQHGWQWKLLGHLVSAEQNEHEDLLFLHQRWDRHSSPAAD